jgi:hypothetical protein
MSALVKFATLSERKILISVLATVKKAAINSLKNAIFYEVRRKNLGAYWGRFRGKTGFGGVKRGVKKALYVPICPSRLIVN